jgi:hypothetical protein
MQMYMQQMLLQVTIRVQQSVAVVVTDLLQTQATVERF